MSRRTARWRREAKGTVRSGTVERIVKAVKR